MSLVLGGGVGGLSAAYYLLKGGKSNIVVAEASNRIGGWVKSVRDKKTGVVLETGPRTIRPVGVPGLNTLGLIEDLNLTNKIVSIKSDHPAATSRYIYVNKKLHVLPNGLKGVLRKTPPFTKALVFYVLRDLFVPAKKCADDSIYNFIERRFGRELADYAVSALTCGVCAGDAKELSVKLLFPNLFEAEQKHRSVLIGMYRMNFFRDQPTAIKIDKTNLSEKAKSERWSVWFLDGGLQTLTDSLCSHITEKGGEVLLNSPCTSIKFDHGEVSCKIADKELHTNHIISSLPATALAPLLREQHKILADELSSIKFVTVGVVNLVFDGQLLKHNGFGFLVPPSEKLPILGVIYDSCVHSYKNKTVLTVMMGGKWFHEYFGDNPENDFLLSTALMQLKNILGIDQEPEVHHVNILKDCIPQYVVGHYDRVNRIFNYIKDNKLPMSFCGSSFEGIGLNDVILLSRKVVNNILKC